MVSEMFVAQAHDAPEARTAPHNAKIAAMPLQPGKCCVALPVRSGVARGPARAATGERAARQAMPRRGWDVVDCF